MDRTKYILFASFGLALTACATTPEPEPEPVTIITKPVSTCTPISALQRVVIPAETETFIAITEIENPPYEPIQRKETQTRVVTPEQVIFVDSEGRQVTDICNPEIAPESTADIGG
jgi:hypothetical protein